jgi:ubiquinone biosynthesis monooxygenase Coq7
MRNKLGSMDRFWIILDHAMWSIYHTTKPYTNPPQPKPEKTSVGGWMRVNYAGEICAQALLLGAMCSAYDNQNFLQFASLMRQEYRHLAWCKERLSALGETSTRFDVIWGSACFMLSSVNGLRGDHYAWSFIEETEVLVIRHLRESHKAISPIDPISADIVRDIMRDELHHAHTANIHYPKKIRSGFLGGMRPLFRVMKTVEM